MRWANLVRWGLPTLIALFVAWWLSFSQQHRTTFIIPNYREDDFVSLEMSPNGRFLLSRNFVTGWVSTKRPDTYLHCWNLDRNELCWTNTLAEDDFWSVGVFSPDDRWIAVPTKTNTVRLWNLLTGKTQTEHPLQGKARQWSKGLAYTTASTLVGFQQEQDEETTMVYEVESGRECYRLPKGRVTPLFADQVLHSFEGRLRLFRLDDGLDLSKPYLQNPFQKVERDENGELVSSFSRSHDFVGCTHDGTVLFGTFRLGGRMSSTYNFYHDYKDGTSDRLDAGWGQLERTFLRPSWTRKYLLKAGVSSPLEWLSQWLPLSSGKSLIVRDYESKRELFSIANGETGAFSWDDRILATYGGHGQIQIWDLPPRMPWLILIGGAAGAWVGTVLLMHWGLRRSQSSKHA